MDLYKIMTEIQPRFVADGENICHFVYEHPEIGMEEFESSAFLADYMEKKGFKVTKPYCGVETAFLATYGEEGPQIDFLAEYDALPGYGDDKHNAHACGHNWIAGSTAEAALIMAEMVRDGCIKAIIRYVGTPAEENVGGKILEQQKGAFNNTDLSLQCHLSDKTNVAVTALAMNSFEYSFAGRASHAAGAPWDGINALDAVNLMFSGVNCLRQHVTPDTRIHGIVTYGGLAPNIVPDKAGCKFYIRAAERSYLNTVIEKVHNIAKGAALMTGATLSIEETELPFDNLVLVKSLSLLGEKYLVKEGITPDNTYGHLGSGAGSTDVGNVSYVCPTLYMEVAPIDHPVFPHEESALALVDSEYAYDCMHRCVRAMCGVALELIETNGFAALKEEYLKTRV